MRYKAIAAMDKVKPEYTKYATVSMAKETRDRAEEAAWRLGVTRAKLVQMALDAYLAEKTGTLPGSGKRRHGLGRLVTVVED